MANIQPLKAWRYARELDNDIESLTSPLFDVVSKKQLDSLYENELNSIHLSVPNGESAAMRAADILNKWKESGVLKQDPLPGIYVYYQYFRLPGDDREHCRKGFISNIQIHDWDEKVILRHESTMKKSVKDRVDILVETQLNVSATHGFYTDPLQELEAYMDESMKNTIYETEDYQGVKDVLSVIHDADIIKKFVSVLKDKQIILGDGHHRYEGSLIHMKNQRDGNDGHLGSEGYNYHMMYLTNTESDEFRILPTHRLISGLEGFTEQKLISKLKEDFEVTSVGDSFDLSSILLNKQRAFGLIFKSNSYIIELKRENVEGIPWPFPDEIKSLDITVMHYYVIEKAIGIKGKDQRYSDNITFDRSLSECLAKVIRDEAQVAIIANEISMKQVKNVCYSGFTMPQKTTFFYPKVICGFLFSSIKEDEFKLPFDFSIK